MITLGMRRGWPAVLLLGAVGLACTRPEPLDRGELAYYAGDFADAMATLRPLAEHGSPKAAYYVGRMLARGEGVAADPAAAARWYRMAATEGQVDAQLELAVLFREGRGVPRDLRETYAWYALAADQGDVQAESALATLERDLGAEELREAHHRFAALMAELEKPPPPLGTGSPAPGPTTP